MDEVLIYYGRKVFKIPLKKLESLHSLHKNKQNTALNGYHRRDVVRGIG